MARSQTAAKQKTLFAHRTVPLQIRLVVGETDAAASTNTAAVAHLHAEARSTVLWHTLATLPASARSRSEMRQLIRVYRRVARSLSGRFRTPSRHVRVGRSVVYNHCLRNTAASRLATSDDAQLPLTGDVIHGCTHSRDALSRSGRELCITDSGVPDLNTRDPNIEQLPLRKIHIFDFALNFFRRIGRTRR
ncbi:hypothetical protein PHSY_001520 [Pseudozyma hubeiensis SY62]|uniref:Uncharacterized protein n=1 Tax=Pseudozyma hubeiensis (strain SY62) TaxID=1305764 RepID=R9NZ06_PSEHS|nr:hypothetical protein PHSY_001520 [Pseudozyma hubeiensis SY62]GAC93951.1 hypothetical protein PHSY_001520 [Pseudozyma hubeiensis SY62]